MRYVIAVCDAGGFEAAAHLLRMSQPPLSRQIRQLERELGVQLFHRRPTRPTEAGLVFIESARQILADTEQAVERTRRAAQPAVRQVRIGYTVTAAFGEMPALFAALAERHPGVRVEAHEGWDTALSTALVEEKLDVVLGRCLDLPAGAGSRVLRRDRWAVVVGAEHRLAGAGTVKLRELRGETLRFFPRHLAPRYHDTVLAALHSTGEAFEVWENPLPGLRNLGVSLSREGFMLLPDSLTGHLPAGVCGLAISDELPTIDLALSWTVPASAAARLLVDTAERMARAESWPRPGRRRP